MKENKTTINATINNALIKLENSNDSVAQLLSYLMLQGEISLAHTLIDMTNAKHIETVKRANRMTNEQLTAYIRDNMRLVFENDLFSVSVLYAFCARMVMSKLKGKYKQHADNLHVRNRRFNFIKAYKRFIDNGLLLDKQYSLEQINEARDTEFKRIRETLREYTDTEKACDNMLTMFCVKKRLNAICENMRDASMDDMTKEKHDLLYSDIELLNEYIIALLDYMKETKETDCNIDSVIVSEYFDCFVDRITNKVSYKTETISARTYAMRALDKAIGYYRRVAIGEIGDVERTETGSEKRGIDYMTREEFSLYNRVVSAIMMSEKIARSEKADYIVILYMRMQGYGYRAIARYIDFTEIKVQNALRKLGLIIATFPQFENIISIEKNKSRNLVPIINRTETSETETATISDLMTATTYHKPQGSFNYDRDNLIVYSSKIIKQATK